MNNLGKYLIAYAVWAIGINTIDYFTPWLRKQEGGGWQKAESFPYWDNWSWTHIGWGALASLMGLSTPTFVVINAANELILEKALCHAANNTEAIKFSAKSTRTARWTAKWTTRPTRSARSARSATG